MIQIFKKTILWILFILVTYLGIGLVIHHFIIPPKMPNYTDYFKIGHSFHSHLEGLTQTITQVKQDELSTDITLQPQSKGPVVHIHEHFDETFMVKSGTLSMQYGSEIKKLHAGETIIIPKNTPHRPFNETDSPVIISSKMPLHFAYCLSQIYPFWDESEANTKPPNVIFQLAVFGDLFDSYPTENAPPKAILKTMKFLLAPTARLMGYKKYNEQYIPK